MSPTPVPNRTPNACFLHSLWTPFGARATPSHLYLQCLRSFVVISGFDGKALGVACFLRPNSVCNSSLLKLPHFSTHFPAPARQTVPGITSAFPAATQERLDGSIGLPYSPPRSAANCYVVLGCVSARDWTLWEYSSAVVVAIVFTSSVPFQRRAPILLHRYSTFQEADVFLRPPPFLELHSHTTALGAALLQAAAAFWNPSLLTGSTHTVCEVTAQTLLSPRATLHAPALKSEPGPFEHAGRWTTRAKQTRALLPYSCFMGLPCTRPSVGVESHI